MKIPYKLEKNMIRTLTEYPFSASRSMKQLLSTEVPDLIGDVAKNLTDTLATGRVQAYDSHPQKKSRGTIDSSTGERPHLL